MSANASPTSEDGSQLIRLGIAAMDRKSRSKPMRNILSRILAKGKYEVIIFGDKVILDENIEDWPVCDFLISFYSTNFPIDKAIQYVKLRKPICINDLPMQKVFWDRRVVLQILDHIGVPTPKRLEVDRDGGPRLDPELVEQISNEVGIRVDRTRPETTFSYKDDVVTVNGDSLVKSYVEKPVSGEDHNINIYFSQKRGGGGRRLFRKIGNKSSEHDNSLKEPRTEGSYVYEQFMDVENAEDIKVYTLGPNFAHAETRKSPVVDGVVRRNTDGKEIRYVAKLTEEEYGIASRIARTFKQNICGFDLLRVKDKSYVIDVNGWSFVKGNDFYYDKCAEILARFCETQLPSLPTAPALTGIATPTESKSWRLKSSISVFRHADRTPKMKLKFAFKGKDAWSKPLIDLLQDRKDEIILRQTEQLSYIVDAANKALELEGADADKLHQLLRILDSKVGQAGTKAQIKPTFDAETGECEKVQLIIKWGGEFTHAARYQSRDLGENIRKDFSIMKKSLLNNTTIYTSSERRVVATAEIFSGALLDDTRNEKGEPVQHELIVRKDLLDDSNAAKEPMDKVKKRLKTLLRWGEAQRPEFTWSVPNVEPVEVAAETMELMRYHRDVLNENWKLLDVENIQARWCCGEYPDLFRERWEKLFGDFCDIDQEKFEPSRVSELYDNLKYDALHNRVFLEAIFTSAKDKVEAEKSARHSRSTTSLSSNGTSTTSAGDGVPIEVVPSKLKQLYLRAKELFDLIGPQEYGIERKEKEEIGLLTSWPLLRQIEQDLRNSATSEQGHASFYFTKESHIQTLVNLILLSDLQIVMKSVPELDYMAYMTFEMYERAVDNGHEFSVRISLSEGAHGMPLDTSLDAKHALRVQQRRVLTNHIPFPDVLAAFARYSRESILLKKSTTPFEGMLPVEGDALFLGKPDQHIQTLHFRPETRPSRPHSIASAEDSN